MLPSGQWAAYDPAYYKKFYDKWKKEYDAHVRALEKGTIKGFEGAAEEAEEVNALREMEKAKQDIQEREERKALTTASGEVPEAPKMNIKVRWLAQNLPLVLTSSRVLHLEGEHDQGINFRLCSPRHTRIGRRWRRRLPKAGETARKLATNTVSSSLSSVSHCSCLCSRFPQVSKPFNVVLTLLYTSCSLKFRQSKPYIPDSIRHIKTNLRNTCVEYATDSAVSQKPLWFTSGWMSTLQAN